MDNIEENTCLSEAIEDELRMLYIHIKIGNRTSIDERIKDTKNNILRIIKHRK